MDADVKLGVAKAEARHPCGPDGDVALARMLQEDDPGHRLERGDVAAVADALGSPATRAHGSRLGDGGTSHLR
jgi:hypothetical protein